MPMNEGAREMAERYEPRVIAFVCNWGAYAAAEIAGVGRLQYPANVRLIRLMCLGQLHPSQIIAPFEMGADGVILLACPPAECHYGFGSRKAGEAFDETKEMLTVLGIDETRLRLEWIPPADGTLFVAVLKDFVSIVRQAGPTPFAGEVAAAHQIPGAAFKRHQGDQEVVEK